MVDTNDQARALVRRLGGEQIERFMAPDGAERDLFRIPRPAARRPDAPQCAGQARRARATPHCGRHRAAGIPSARRRIEHRIELRRAATR